MDAVLGHAEREGGEGVGVTTWPHTGGLRCLLSDRRGDVKHQARNSCGSSENKEESEWKICLTFLSLLFFIFARSPSSEMRRWRFQATLSGERAAVVRMTDTQKMFNAKPIQLSPNSRVSGS